MRAPPPQAPGSRGGGPPVNPAARVQSAPVGAGAGIDYRLISGPEQPGPGAAPTVVEVWAGKPARAVARGVRRFCDLKDPCVDPRACRVLEQEHCC